MCIAYISINPSSNYKLLIAMNRDEFYDRHFLPTMKINDLFYPVDTRSQGTWFSFNVQGDFALLTNIRKIDQPTPEKSRGDIVLNILKNQILPNPKDYRLFNLLWGNSNKINHYSSFSEKQTEISFPSFTISNSRTIPSTWDKEIQLKESIDKLLSKNLDINEVFKILSYKTSNNIQKTDHTGFEESIEQMLTLFCIHTRNEIWHGTSVCLLD